MLIVFNQSLGSFKQRGFQIIMQLDSNSATKKNRHLKFRNVLRQFIYFTRREKALENQCVSLI